jgi:hypothetical protein
MLFNSHDKHLIFIKHFTDSSLQVGEGLFSSFYNKNIKESEGYYESGKEDGLWQKWDSSGALIDSTTYDSGRVITEATFHYQPVGKLVREAIDDPVKKTHREILYDGDKITSDTTLALPYHHDNDIIFIKTEVESAFPGGNEAWPKYISRKIDKRIDELSKSDNCTCLVRFVIDTEGNISNVQAMTFENTKLAEVAIHAIQIGPKWIPAMQNGRKVKSYRLQPVTFTGDSKNSR